MPCNDNTNTQDLAYDNGNLEYVLEGQGKHPCYRVYKHDKEYIPGETAWIKYSWNGKYKKVQEEHLMQLYHL